MNQESKNSFTSGIMAGIMCLVAGGVGSFVGVEFERNKVAEEEKGKVINFESDHLRIALAKCDGFVHALHPLDKIYYCVNGERIFMDHEMGLVREIQADGSTDPVSDYVKQLERKKYEFDKDAKERKDRDYAKRLITHNVKVIEIEKTCENHQGFHHHNMTPHFALCRDGYYVAHGQYPLEEDMVRSNLRIDMDIVKQIKIPAVYE